MNNRKEDHLKLAVLNSAKSDASNGFEKYKFLHNALPELNFDHIDMSTRFLGYNVDMPLMILPITGGTEHLSKINYALAGLANDFNIPFSVGSQRIAIDNEELEWTFQVRKYARNVPLLANLGAVQLNYGYSSEQCLRAVEMIQADGLILHLNALHEVFQANGNKDFSNLLKKIEHICKKLPIPVIVKEVGYGISDVLAKKLFSIGVYAVDVAGTGGVSWSTVESMRTTDIVLQKVASSFKTWGISTAQCIVSIKKLIPQSKIIASGGINNGVDVAKAIALGADFAGIATSILKNVILSREDAENFLEIVKLELHTAMFAIGAANINQLKNTNMLYSINQDR